MKYSFLALLSSVLFFSCANSEAGTKETTATATTNPATEPAPINDEASLTTIQWLDSSHQDLGKVNEGQVVEVSWKFKNNGSKPLIINGASASCGCTVAEKPEAPIAPGEEGIIKAKFDSKNREGMQRKDVYVTANTKGLRDHQLSFAVEVQKK